MITLYKLDNKDKVRVWNIYIEDGQGISAYDIVVSSGLLDGKLTFATTPIMSGLGGKTAFEQANADMQTEINKKVKGGYVYKIKDIKPAGSSATIPKPMKAESYHPTGKDKRKTLDNLKLRGQYGYIQRKIDGWRFRINIKFTYILDDDGNPCGEYPKITYYTSSGDVTLDFPQISKSLEKSFLFYTRDVEFLEELTLDGEIYNHELGFQATASACGSVKHIDSEKQALRNKMQFYIFDIVDTKYSYDDRRNLCKSFVDGINIIDVETIGVTLTDEIIDTMFNQFLSEGYEGLMIRRANSLYEHKRSKNLIKYKPKCDDEFKIVGFKESIEKNTLGSLICEMKDGRTFDCNLKGEIGTDKIKKIIWFSQERHLGMWVTVEFLEYTKDGIPRHPYAKGFRKGQGLD